MPSSNDQRMFRVSAVYPTMQQAKRGVEALEESGVEGSDIELRGQAARAATTTGDTEQRDTAFLRQAGRNAARGIVSGGLVGAVFGLVIGVIGFSDRMGALAALVIGGLVAGAGLGLLVFSLATQKQSQAWEATLEDVDGPVVVGVRTTDADELETAAKALAGTEPERLERFDAAGNRMPD